MGRTLLKISVVYFMIGISFGLYMSLTHVFTMTTVHVHVNLLGWMSLALVGLFYHLYPTLEKVNLGIRAGILGISMPRWMRPE